MDNSPKIEISSEAYATLFNILSEHPEYNCVRFAYINSCCKNTKIDIILDEVKEQDFIKKYDDISIVYSEELKNKIKNIYLKYENSTFMLKCEPFDKNSSSCSKGSCSGCSKECCKAHSNK